MSFARLHALYLERCSNCAEGQPGLDPRRQGADVVLQAAPEPKMLIARAVPTTGSNS